jgi:transcription initiation factor IIE alpha subunit
MGNKRKPAQAQTEQLNKGAVASVLKLVYQDIQVMNSKGFYLTFTDEQLAAKYAATVPIIKEVLRQLLESGSITEIVTCEAGSNCCNDENCGVTKRHLKVTDLAVVREMNTLLIKDAQEATDFFLRFMARGNELTIPYWLMQVADLNWNDKMLLVGIVCNYNANTLLKCTNKDLADAFCMSERTVSRSLNHLEQRNLIRRITTYYGDRYGRFIIPNIPEIKLLISPMKAAA